MATRSRQRVTKAMAIYRTGDAGSPLLATATYARVLEYAPPVVAQQYINPEAGIGNDKIPERWELPSFTITFEDYSLTPERLLDGALHFFESKEVLPGAPGGAAEEIYPARYHAYVTSVDPGTVRRGRVTPMIVTLDPIEVWRRAPGATATFTGTSPTVDDTFRLNVREDIWWANGVDRLLARGRLLGITS